MRIRKMGTALLPILILLSGCAAPGISLPEAASGEALSISAWFQMEDGDALQGSAAQFSVQETSYPLDSGGRINVPGLPRSGELLMTLFDQRQEVQGVMTLSFDQGAVIDATTGEDGVGHITVRDDTDEVALLFVLDENGSLTCTLWLKQADSPGEGVPQKGTEHGKFSVGYYRSGT